MNYSESFDLVLRYALFAFVLLVIYIKNTRKTIRTLAWAAGIVAGVLAFFRGQEIYWDIRFNDVHQTSGARVIEAASHIAAVRISFSSQFVSIVSLIIVLTIVAVTLFRLTKKMLS